MFTQSLNCLKSRYLVFFSSRGVSRHVRRDISQEDGEKIVGFCFGSRIRSLYFQQRLALRRTMWQRRCTLWETALWPEANYHGHVDNHVKDGTASPNNWQAKAAMRPPEIELACIPRSFPPSSRIYLYLRNDFDTNISLFVQPRGITASRTLELVNQTTFCQIIKSKQNNRGLSLSSECLPYLKLETWYDEIAMFSIP